MKSAISRPVPAHPHVALVTGASGLTFRGSREAFRRNFPPRARRPELLRRFEFDQVQGLSLPGPQ